jgi:hypothetical protein
MGSDEVYIVYLLMEFVVTQLILNPEKQQYYTGHTDGQTGNIDERVGFVSSDVSKSNF